MKTYTYTDDRVLNENEKLAAQLRAANKRIDAIHNLHSRTSYDPSQCYCGNAYPCRTIQALNVDSA